MRRVDSDLGAFFSLLTISPFFLQVVVNEREWLLRIRYNSGTTIVVLGDWAYS